MSASTNIGREGMKPPRQAFPCAAYLFGMVTAAPVVTYFLLRALNPNRDGNLPQGAVDPLLTFLVLPTIGAAVGFILVAMLNLAYRVMRRG